MRNNAARAKARAKANPQASSEKSASARKQRADWRSLEAKRMQREGATVADIAQSLGVCPATVYNLLARRYESPIQPPLI